MKFKTTKKAILAGYRNIICVGYCDLQALLGFKDPIAYTTRSEGWAADIYDVNGTAIVTGYAPFGNIRPGYEANKSYNDKAYAIRCLDTPWQDQRDQIDALLGEYVKEALQKE
jgi:hypothetical protein